MVLEDYLYVALFLCSLCGFNIFGAEAIFSVDACHLFPQHMFTIIALMGVCRCGGWCLVLGFVVVVVTHTRLWSSL